MIELMEMESIPLIQVPNILVSGKMINNKILVNNHGRMEHYTRVNIRMVKSMAKEYLLG